MFSCAVLAGWTILPKLVSSNPIDIDQANQLAIALTNDGNVGSIFSFERCGPMFSAYKPYQTETFSLGILHTYLFTHPCLIANLRVYH